MSKASCFSSEKKACRDKAPLQSCKSWKKRSFCTKKYVSYMKKNCAKTCGTCWAHLHNSQPITNKTHLICVISHFLMWCVISVPLRNIQEMMAPRKETRLYLHIKFYSFPNKLQQNLWPLLFFFEFHTAE